MDLLLCRVCLKKEDELYHIVDSIKPQCPGKYESVSKFYDFIREILITKDNQNSRHICQNCRSIVHNVYTLLEQCENSNAIQSKNKLKIRLCDTNTQKAPIAKKQGVVEVCSEDAENFDSSNGAVDTKNETVVKNNLIDEDVKTIRQSSNIVHEEGRDADETVELVIMEENDERMLFGDDISKSNNPGTPPKKHIIYNSMESVVCELANAINDEIDTDFDSPANNANAPNKASGCETIDLSSPEPPEIVDDDDTRSTNEINKCVSQLQSNQFACGICKNMVYKPYHEAHRIYHMKHAFRFFSVKLDRDVLCLKCHESCKTAYLLKEHIKATHLVEENNDDITQKWCSFICLICFKSSIEPHMLKVHIHNHMIQAGKLKDFECLECPSTHTTFDGLRRHIKALHQVQFSCLICLTRFNDKGDLLKHIISKHGKDKLFSCKICSSVCVYESDLIEHTLDCDAKYSCNRCSFKFANMADVRAHEAFHNFGAYKCDDCKLSFTGKGFLKQHLDKHLRHFYCELCRRYVPDVCKYTHHIFRHIRNGETFDGHHVTYPNENKGPSRKRKSTPDLPIENEAEAPPIRHVAASASNPKKALIIRSENKCYIIVPKTDDGLIPSGSAGLQITLNGISARNRSAAVTSTPQSKDLLQTNSGPHRMVVSENSQASSESESNVTIVIGDGSTEKRVSVREPVENRLQRYENPKSGLQIAQVYSAESMSAAPNSPGETLNALHNSAFYPTTLVHRTEGDFLISEINEDDFKAANEYRVQSFDPNSVQIPNFQEGNHCSVNIPQAVLSTLQQPTATSSLNINDSGQPGAEGIANTVNIVIDSSDEDD